MLNQKGFAHLLVVLILLISIPIGIYLVLHPAIFKPKADETNISNPQKFPDKYGYIIELKDDPVVVQKKAKPNSSDDQIKASLKTTREEAKKDIFKRLGFNYPNPLKQTSRPGEKSVQVSQEDKTPLILGEYENVFNGFSMKIDKKQAEKIKKSAYVKGVFPNLEVKTNLKESVPLIGADKVWGLADTKQVAITGQGLNVAVIDTGVDTTHPDLGNTVVNERALTKITEYPMGASRFFENDQYFVTDGNRLIYGRDKDFGIYLFDNKTTTYYSPSFPTLLNIIKIAVKGKYIAYGALSTNQSETGVYLYNTEDKTNKLIAVTDYVGGMKFSDDALIYQRSGGLFTYNLSSGAESLIDGQFLNNPQISGSTLVYSVSGSYCYDKLVVYDLVTKNKKTITPPGFGVVVDFKDNKALILGCVGNWSTYYLFDINTKEYSTLQSPVSNSSTSVSSQEKKTQSSYIGYTSLINKGSIQNGLVYFSKDSNSNRLMIYDQDLKRYVQVTLFKASGGIAADGNRVCFLSSDLEIYCHIYDKNNSYPLANIYNQKVVSGYNFINNSDNSFDDNGHGTHVAATIAGNGSIKGVAPGAKITSYKVLDSYGYGSFSSVIAAIDKAVSTRQDADKTNDVDIISMSLGAYCGGSYSVHCGPDDPQSRAVDRAVENGIVAVIAAGNNGPGLSTIGTPGTAQRALTVGAVDKNKIIANFSSRGPVNYGFLSIFKPDVVAPGVNICAAKYSGFGSSSSCVDSQHISLSGTSMATPHVAGLAALLKQLHPDWSAVKIKTEISSKTNSLGYVRDIEGNGLVNATKLFEGIPALVPANPYGDNDFDGFLDAIEKAIGTNPSKFCASDSSDNAWPADANNDGKVDGRDLSMLSPIINGIQSYNKRFDLNNDGKVDLADSSLVARYFGQGCSKNIGFIIPQDRVDLEMSVGGTGKAFDIVQNGNIEDFSLSSNPIGLGASLNLSASIKQIQPTKTYEVVLFATGNTTPGVYQGNIFVTYNVDQKLTLPVKVTIYPVGGKPKVSILNPNGGESFTTNTTQRITWTSSAVDSCTLYYATEDEISYIIADVSDPKDGFYNWLVKVDPTAVGKKVKAKISCRVASLPTISDMSDQFFNISP